MWEELGEWWHVDVREDEEMGSLRSFLEWCFCRRVRWGPLTSGISSTFTSLPGPPGPPREDVRGVPAGEGIQQRPLEAGECGGRSLHGHCRLGLVCKNLPMFFQTGWLLFSRQVVSWLLCVLQCRSPLEAPLSSGRNPSPTTMGINIWLLLLPSSR